MDCMDRYKWEDVSPVKFIFFRYKFEVYIELAAFICVFWVLSWSYIKNTMYTIFIHWLFTVITWYTVLALIYSILHDCKSEMVISADTRYYGITCYCHLLIMTGAAYKVCCCAGIAVVSFVSEALYCDTLGLFFFHVCL